MGPFAGVDYNLTLCRLQSRVDSNTCTWYHGATHARVNLNPMPESTLSPSQGLRIWPLTWHRVSWCGGQKTNERGDCCQSTVKRGRHLFSSPVARQGETVRDYTLATRSYIQCASTSFCGLKDNEAKNLTYFSSVCELLLRNVTVSPNYKARQIKMTVIKLRPRLPDQELLHITLQFLLGT